MRLMAVAIAAATAVAVFAASTAEAKPRKRAVSYPYRMANPAVAGSGSTVFVSRDEFGRTRTRIIVQKRSYLDGGTEVLPGQRKFTDYAYPPYWSPIDVLGPGRNYDRQPLNPRWESGGPRMSF